MLIQILTAYEGNGGKLLSPRYGQAPDSETSLIPVSSVSHVNYRLELQNNNWASGSQHPGPSESDV